ncbi:MAG: IS1595 family transposase [Desulforhopalus sp.]
MASRSEIHFQPGVSMNRFFQQYGTEELCKAKLFRAKWPDGFRCPKCGYEQYYFIHSRNLYQCRKCRHQTSLLSETIFSSSKLPLTIWFLAIYLVTQSKEGISTLKLMRFLGISSKAALMIKHKLQMVMKKADDIIPLRGLVQVDDVYWGSKKTGCKRGRGAAGKTPFVAALQRNEHGHPIFIRFSRVNGFTSEEMREWARAHLQPKSIVVSDKLSCFQSFKKGGHIHFSVKTSGKNPKGMSVFKWLNTIIGNVKNSIRGTHHGMDHRHLPRYLGEFCFRFNRRFKLDLLLESLIRYSAFTKPIPQHQLVLAEDWW